MLVAGYKARLAALAIFVFLIPTTFIFHAYWQLPADKQMIDFLAFWKNLAIMGGLLMVYAMGPGRLSVDKG
jgi:putative oxidoreductase